MEHESTTRVEGSFRDPSGYVFQREGRIFRAIDDECARVLREISDAGQLARLIDSKSIVDTSFVSDSELNSQLAAEQPGYEDFLEHEVLSTITFPYEWSISMLADAAIHTLDLQLELARAGFSLKDGTAYNIQFIHGDPIFIDVSSIERPKRQDIWFALGQFSQMFTFPLLLCRFAGWNLRSYFQGNLSGLGLEDVARNFSWTQRLHPRLLLDLTIPLAMHRRSEARDRRAESDDSPTRQPLDRSNADSSAQVVNLNRLKSKITKLASSYKPQGVWSGYTGCCNYDESAEQAKRSMIESFLRSTNPARVLDVGCNTGEYSRLAAASGAEVVAIDADHDAIEMMYRQLKKKPERITPLVVDACNPSPGIGFMNRERPSFLDRVDADCVFALALLHHLMVSGNLPLDAVRDMFYSMTNRDLVLEFIPTDDSMFRRLMKFRVDLFESLTLEACRNVFSERFEVVDEQPVTNSKRTMLFLRKR